MIYKVTITENNNIDIEADGFNTNYDNRAVTFRKYTKEDKSAWENVAIFNFDNIIGFMRIGDNAE